MAPLLSLTPFGSDMAWACGKTELRRGGEWSCHRFSPVVSRNSITTECADVQVVGVFALEPEIGSAEEGELGCRERLGGLLRYYYRLPGRGMKATIRVSGHYGEPVGVARGRRRPAPAAVGALTGRQFAGSKGKRHPRSNSPSHLVAAFAWLLNGQFSTNPVPLIGSAWNPPPHPCLPARSHPPGNPAIRRDAGRSCWSSCWCRLSAVIRGTSRRHAKRPGCSRRPAI